MKTISFKVPIEQLKDRQRLIQAASILPRRTVRGLEVLHSQPDNETDFRLVAEDRDVEGFFRDFRLGYPVVRTQDVKQEGLNPRWLPKVLESPQSITFFDIELVNRHGFALLDLNSVGTTLTPLLNSLQNTQYAWLQILFQEVDVTRHWTFLKSHLRNQFNTISRPIPVKHRVKDEDGKLKEEIKYVDHPEKKGEFYSVYQRLISQLERKSGSRSIVCVVRGMMTPDVSLNVNVNELGSPEFLPVSGSNDKVGERLQVYYYQNPYFIYDLVQRRLPDIDYFMGRYVKSYYSSRERYNLPYLVLTPEELALFVHLPDPSNLKNLKVTRGVELPQIDDPEKEGVVIGT